MTINNQNMSQHNLIFVVPCFGLLNNIQRYLNLIDNNLAKMKWKLTKEWFSKNIKVHMIICTSNENLYA